jgi:hypothetical protein
MSLHWIRITVQQQKLKEVCGISKVMEMCKQSLKWDKKGSRKIMNLKK